MKAARIPLIAALVLALSAGALLSRAQGAPPPVARPVHKTSPQQRPVSMDRAVRQAQRRFNARVVRAETERQGDRTIYVLRMLDGAGRVFAVRVDAANGAIL